jgi:hypothetical protein
VDKVKSLILRIAAILTACETDITLKTKLQSVLSTLSAGRRGEKKADRLDDSEWGAVAPDEEEEEIFFKRRELVVFVMVTLLCRTNMGVLTDPTLNFNIRFNRLNNLPLLLRTYIG